MNTETITIVTQAPFSTFDHMVIGLVLLFVMTILAARRLLRILTTQTGETKWKRVR